jgi:cell division protein FtsB
MFDKLKLRAANLATQARDRYEALNPREKMLILVLSVTLPIVFVGLIVWSIASSLADLTDTVDSRQKTLAEIIERRDDYGRLKAEAERLKGRIRGISRSVQLFDFLEQKARENGITLSDIKDLGVTRQKVETDIKEKVVEVRVEKVKQSTLSKFLYDIEAAPYMLKIRSLTIRARRETERTLDVSFKVASYEVNDQPQTAETDKADDKKGRRRGRPE